MIQEMKETARILAAVEAKGVSTLHSDLVEVSSKSDKLTQNDLDKFYQMVESRGIAQNRITMYSAHIMG